MKKTMWKIIPSLKSLKTKRSKLTALAMVLPLILSGCMAFDTSMEGLLAAPKLTSTQSEIYNAMLLSLGGEAELVYPRNGTHRSAITLADLDDEESEEAIVFYREKPPVGQIANNNNNQGGIRVGFLDKQEDKWVTVIDLPVDGADIDSLEFYTFDSTVTIGISCSVLSQTEKMLKLMQYSGGSINTLFSGYYSFMEITDLDGDGAEELFYVNYDSLVGYNSAKIWGLSKESEGTRTLAEISTLPLNTDITAVQKITVQDISQNQKYVYLDYFSGDNTYGTQLLYIYRNLLSSPPVSFETKQDLTFSKRVNQYTPLLNSEDVDGDGQVEIPTTESIMGYETSEAADRLYFVRWFGISRDYEYDRTEEMIIPMERKYLSYCDVSNEYIFYIPVRWQGLITAEKEGNIITFYKYDKTEKLLSLCLSKEGIPKGEHWRRFGSVGSNLYVNQPTEGGTISKNSMALTQDELNSCLQLRNQNALQS